MKTPEELAEDHANMRCPEQGPEFIVWCMCKDDFLTGYQAAKESNSLEKPVGSNSSNNLNGWISVKDRLPEIGEYVLVTHRISQDYDGAKVMEARRLNKFEYTVGDGEGLLAEYVDYWMPLPAAPKEAP
jgi:hypothetical protein